MPNDEAEALHRRIALYYEYLRRGVEAEFAVDYLQAIGRSEARLAEIEGKTPKR